MTQQFKFEFEKTYKEVDIAGELHRVDFNDDSILKYGKAFKRFDEDSKKITGLIQNFETATDEEIEQLSVQQKELVKVIVEPFLAEGTFPSLFEKAASSSANLMGLVHYLNEIYLEESQKKTDETRNKYLSNVKK